MGITGSMMLTCLDRAFGALSTEAAEAAYPHRPQRRWGRSSSRRRMGTRTRRVPYDQESAVTIKESAGLGLCLCHLLFLLPSASPAFDACKGYERFLSRPGLHLQ